MKSARAGIPALLTSSLILGCLAVTRSARAVDRRPVAHVADFGLGADLARELAQPLLAACDQHARPPLRAQLPRDLGADAARPARDHCDALVHGYFVLQALIARVAEAVAPSASVIVACSLCGPGPRPLDRHVVAKRP